MANQSKPIANFPGKDLGDELLVYDGTGDALHVLNSTAREIYALCDGQRSEEEVARTLVERYEVDSETALRDTRSTLRQLIDKGLVSLS